MTEPKTLVIVGCGAAKRDEPAPAHDLYTSTYFAKKREYAEAVGDEWAILSAEHGLVEPSEELNPYETSIDDLGDDALNELAHEVGMDLIDWVHWEQTQNSRTTVERIVVLAGKRYLEPLRSRETFHAGIDEEVVFPLQQADLGGIGEQMAWLKKRVEAETTEQTELVTDGGAPSVAIEHDHDAKNHRESLKEALSKLRDAMGDTCPSCGKEIAYLRGSVGMVFADEVVNVRHKRGLPCEHVAVRVKWRSEEVDR